MLKGVETYTAILTPGGRLMHELPIQISHRVWGFLYLGRDHVKAMLCGAYTVTTIEEPG
ncbi:MAG: hypothetical protein GXO23_02580 [Crenarchaeota archaeon]|nr:hypothetical protein [Thermoproteota archaeon]